MLPMGPWIEATWKVCRIMAFIMAISMGVRRLFCLLLGSPNSVLVQGLLLLDLRFKVTGRAYESLGQAQPKTLKLPKHPKTLNP